MDFKDKGCVMIWIEVAQDTAQWWDPAYTVMNLWVL
jgi:hypothetical protein